MLFLELFWPPILMFSKKTYFHPAGGVMLNWSQPDHTLKSLSLPRVPSGTKYHYMLNIWFGQSVFIKFEQQKGLGQIFRLKE